MKHFLTILSHEIRMLLVSPSTYIASVIFLSLMGFVFNRILETYSQAPQSESPADFFFKQFYLPVLFMVPLLTMKCLAEERRQGTIRSSRRPSRPPRWCSENTAPRTRFT